MGNGGFVSIFWSTFESAELELGLGLDEEDEDKDEDEDELTDELEAVSLEDDGDDDDDVLDTAGLGALGSGVETGSIVVRADPSFSVFLLFPFPPSPEVLLLRTPGSCVELPALSLTLAQCQPW